MLLLGKVMLPYRYTVELFLWISICGAGEILEKKCSFAESAAFSGKVLLLGKVVEI